MTTFDSETAALARRAAVRATLAPSVHNTQPWRIELRPNERLDVSPIAAASCGCSIRQVAS